MLLSWGCSSKICSKLHGYTLWVDLWLGERSRSGNLSSSLSQKIPLSFIPSIFLCRYLSGLSFWMYKLSQWLSFTCGAFISATDPISVLAIFQVMLYNYLRFLLTVDRIVLLRQFYYSWVCTIDILDLWEDVKQTDLSPTMKLVSIWLVDLLENIQRSNRKSLLWCIFFSFKSNMLHAVRIVLGFTCIK